MAAPNGFTERELRVIDALGRFWLDLTPPLQGWLGDQNVRRYAYRVRRAGDGSIAFCSFNDLVHAPLKLLLRVLGKKSFANHASLIGQIRFKLWGVIGFTVSHKTSLVLSNKAALHPNLLRAREIRL